MNFKNCNLSLQVKDVTKSGEVLIYASAFGNKDSDGDIMVKGAFAKTIKEMGPSGANRIAALYQHDPYTVVGRPLEMTEDEKGLLIRGYVGDIQNGDFRKMYEQELIREHSIGFRTIKDDWSEIEQANMIREVALWEYSMVTWGANSATPVIGKGMDKEQAIKYAKDRMEKCTKALRNGTFTDETMYLIELEVKQLTDTIIALATEPPKSTREPQIDLDVFKAEFNKHLSN